MHKRMSPYGDYDHMGETINLVNNRLDKAINEFDEQMKTTKNIPFNKNQVIVNKDTFDTMNKIVKESKKSYRITT